MTTAESIVLHRPPCAPSYTRRERHGAPHVVERLADLPRAAGFLVHPFTPAADTPIIYIVPDRVTTHPLRPSAWGGLSLPTSQGVSRAAYHAAYARAMALLRSGRAQKIVLSSVAQYAVSAAQVPLEELFLRACERYPRCAVTLFATPLTGTWLTATPELLLERQGAAGRTMSLAGTLPARPDGAPRPEEWGAKNRREQLVVTQHIMQRLQSAGVSPQAGEPHAWCVGDLVHLRTDIPFRCSPTLPLTTLAEALHPTPAVCGAPTDVVRRALPHIEPQPRRYYAGFAGPVGQTGDASLYVTLRCMELCPDCVRLHAGGGLLPESDEEAEWAEMQRKLAAVRDILIPPSCTPTT